MQQARIVRNIWLGIENLLLHKLRSFLTMLGVVFGVGSVVAMLSVGEGASKHALEQIRKLGSNNIIITSMKSAEEEQASTTHSHMSIYGLTYEDHRRLSESFKNIKETAPAKLMRKDSRLRERAMELRVVGATPAWFRLVPRELVAGRVILQGDQDKRSPVAVLTEFGARKLLATENTIGQTLRIGGNQFEVIGIIQSESGQAGNIQIPDQDIDVYIPLDVSQRYFGDIIAKRTAGTDERELVELQQIIVQVDDPKNAEAVGTGIETMLEQFHNEERLRRERPPGPAQAGGGHQAEVQHRPGVHRGHQSARRRHRHHEHHAGLRHRADARDRHPPGPRGQAQADHLPVPHRDGGPLDHGRTDRAGHRDRDSRSDPVFLRNADRSYDERRPSSLVRQYGDRDRLRDLSRDERGQSRSHHRLET